MIKVFETETKVNFVQDDNTFVGYDLEGKCCEYANWYVAPTPNITGEMPAEENLCKEIPEYYSFRKTYYLEYHPGDDEEGCRVIFKLTSFDHPDLYLHLFNCHNGHYGHGFKVNFYANEREGVL